MGGSPSRVEPPQAPTQATTQRKLDVSECPMHQKDGAAGGAAKASLPAVGGGGGAGEGEACPVSPATRDQYMKKSKKNNKIYNVYGQRIDEEGRRLNPDNNMPAKPAQEKAEDQRIDLTTERVQSTIPKGGTETTWTYPSPQMFWNAIVRKGKKGDTLEEDMNTVVAIHNNMNETTWRLVMGWEDLHTAEERASEGASAGPKLLRFTGRPDENSPKSRLKQLLFGVPAPFDRHDWIVDRDGKEVRYIIDYYHDDEGVDSDKVPGLQDTKTIQSIKLDVRPALDSLESVFDRAVRMPFAIASGMSSYTYLPLNLPHAPAFDEEKVLAEAAKNKTPLPAKYQAIQDQMDTKCAAARERLKKCNSESDCQNASIALNVCVGSIICPTQATAFTKAVEGGKLEGDLEQAFTAMHNCMTTFETTSKREIAELLAKTK